MAKKESFTFAPLPSPSKLVEEPKKGTPAIHATAAPILHRVTLDIGNDNLEKVKDLGYWEGLSQSEVIGLALDQYFSKKTVQPRPEKVKNKRKPGRKPKLN